MNIKELYSQILKEFTVDNDGKPMHNPEHHTVLEKHGYEWFTNTPKESFWEPKGHSKHFETIHVNHKDGSWSHEAHHDDDDEPKEYSGKNHEDLDKHLTDFHK